MQVRGLIQREPERTGCGKALQLKQFIYDQVEFFIRQLDAGDIFDIERLQLEKPEIFWKNAYKSNEAENFRKNCYTVLHNYI